MSAHDPSASLAPEPDHTPAGVLFAVLVLVLIFMFASIGAIVPIVRLRLQNLTLAAGSAGPSAEIIDQRAREAQELGTFGKNDDGSYRIPASRAAQRVLENPGLLAGVALAGAPAVAAPVDGALPADGSLPTDGLPPADGAAPVVADGAAASGDPAVGQQLYMARGCIACHTLDGAKGLGPTFKGVWGRQEKLADGSSVTVDEAYVRRSIAEPTAQLVEGFPPVMPPVAGLTDAEIAGLIAFLRTL